MERFTERFRAGQPGGWGTTLGVWGPDCKALQGRSFRAVEEGSRGWRTFSRPELDRSSETCVDSSLPGGETRLGVRP